MSNETERLVICENCESPIAAEDTTYQDAEGVTVCDACARELGWIGGDDDDEDDVIHVAAVARAEEAEARAEKAEAQVARVLADLKSERQNSAYWFTQAQTAYADRDSAVDGCEQCNKELQHEVGMTQAAESDLVGAQDEIILLKDDVSSLCTANQQLVDENNKLLAQVARYRLALADTPENVTDAMKAYWDVKGDRRGSMTATLAHLRAQAERPTANPEQAVIPNVGGTYEDAIAAWAASHS